MRNRRAWVVQGLLLVGALSFVGAKGCVFDGDASLGSTDGQGEAGETGNGAGAASNGVGGSLGAAGKAASSIGGKSNGSSGASSLPGGGTSSTAGKPNADGGTNTGGQSNPGGGSSSGRASAGDAGESGIAGEPAVGGAPSGKCALPIDPGACDDNENNSTLYGYDAEAGECVPFTYRACEGNANRFASLEACMFECNNLTCPSHLQTDTVFFVAPLNRSPGACLVLDKPVHVSCSMLLDPSLTVPTDWPTQRCAKRGGNTFYAVTTLPKAEGWTDCSDGEAGFVERAQDCALPAP